MPQQKQSFSFLPRLSKNIVMVLVWLVFTASLASWWWIFALRELNLNASLVANQPNKHSMIMTEGFILVMMIVLGGGYLIYLIHQDQKRQERLQFFFSAFTHDIKTSISRLRLQADILTESSAEQPTLQRLAKDIQRLDLQLENSLVLTNPDAPLLKEDVSLTKLLQVIRQEFPEMNFELTQDAVVRADSKALILIFRNIIQNAIIHGRATQIQISPRQQSSQHVLLTINNDGSPFQGDLLKLGREILSSDNSQSNGLGLFIVKNLTEKMLGKTLFVNSSNFQIQITLPGKTS